jgi:hypothetical protein
MKQTSYRVIALSKNNVCIPNGTESNLFIVACLPHFCMAPRPRIILGQVIRNLEPRRLGTHKKVTLRLVARGLFETP